MYVYQQTPGFQIRQQPVQDTSSFTRQQPVLQDTSSFIEKLGIPQARYGFTFLLVIIFWRTRLQNLMFQCQG